MASKLKKYGILIVAAILLLTLTFSGVASATESITIRNSTAEDMIILSDLGITHTFYGDCGGIFNNGTAELKYETGRWVLELNAFNISNLTGNTPLIYANVQNLKIVLKGESYLNASYSNEEFGAIYVSGNLMITTLPNIRGKVFVNNTVISGPVTAIKADGNLMIMGEKTVIYAYANGCSKDIISIYALNDIKIESANHVSVISEMSDNSNHAYGIYSYAGDITIINTPNVDVSVNSKEGNAYSIYCKEGSLDIIGSNVIAIVNAKSSVYTSSMTAGHNIMISQSSITAIVNNFGGATALDSNFGAILINDSSRVNAYANSTHGPAFSIYAVFDIKIDSAYQISAIAEAPIASHSAQGIFSQAGDIIVNNTQNIDINANSTYGTAFSMHATQDIGIKSVRSIKANATGINGFAIIGANVSIDSCNLLYANGTNSSFGFNKSTGSFKIDTLNTDYLFSNATTPGADPSSFNQFLNNWHAGKKSGLEYNLSNYTSVKITSIPHYIDSGICGDNLSWTLTDDGILTISGTGAMYDYILSSGSPWHQYRTQMTKLILENGITTIGEWAFEGCEGFTGKLILPNSITMLNDSAFYGCSGFTGSLEIPTSISCINYSAFRDCSGFRGVLEISENVTSIGNWAFDGCAGLTAFNVDINNPHYSSDEQGLLYDKHKFNLIECPSGKSGSIIVPSSINSIQEHVFDRCYNLTNVFLPSTISSIGKLAFYNCTGLIDIILPSELSKIDNAAFKGCTGLTSISIPANVKEIGLEAFSHCTGLTSITIPANVTSLGSRIAPGVGGVFDGCSNLTAINVDSANQNFSSDDMGILYNKNKSILIEYPIGRTGSFVIPNTVMMIEDTAFRYCNGLTNVLIPSSVTTIGYQTFCYCTNLTNITIPSSVTTVGNMALSYLHSDSIVYAEGDLETVYRISPEDSAIAIKNTDNTYTFTVGGYYYPEGFPLTDANAPTKSGYEFNGWYLNSTYTGNKVTSVSNKQTLYAKWTAGPAKNFTNTSGTIVLDPGYTVNKINVNGTNIGNISFAYDQNVSAPSRSGYHNQEAFGDAFNITLVDGSFNGGKAKIYFNISKADLGTRDTSNIMLAHFSNGMWEYLKTVKESEDSVNVQFSAETTSFSPFLPMYMVADSPQYSPSSSSRQTGGTYILPESATPAATTTATDTSVSATPGTPTAHQTQASPAPIVGLIAGLGAAALVLARIRR